MTPVLHFHSGILSGEENSTYLTPGQARLLVTIARGHPVDLYTGRLTESMWPDPDGEPNSAENLISVLICKLRPKIRPFGLSIPLSFTSHRRRLDGELHIDWRRDPAVKPCRFNLPCRPYEARA